jgi:4-diphosphocytidyl-2-C-methyl-D-erythritol kinase
MVSFLNCKINLGLHITSKRADGYHNLETVFYPVAINDAIEIVVSKTNNEIIFTCSGQIIDVPNQSNLCVKAFRLIKKDYPQVPNINMHLHKNIPMGAGLGGGSANASAVLMLLNKTFELNITEQQLLNFALQLGSDCPFFIKNTPQFATGRGEIFTPVNTDLSNYKLMIVNPGIHVNTAAAFGMLDATKFSNEGSLAPIIASDVSLWKNNLKNDFEIPVFNMHPEIEKIKNTLYDNGAIYSAMSGSGSSVFGLFAKDFKPTIKFPSQYFCKVV